MASEKAQETDTKKNIAIRKNAKKFMLGNDALLLQKKDIFRVFPPTGQRPEMLTTFHNYICHWVHEKVRERSLLLA